MVNPDGSSERLSRQEQSDKLQLLLAPRGVYFTKHCSSKGCYGNGFIQGNRPTHKGKSLDPPDVTMVGPWYHSYLGSQFKGQM